MSVAGLRRLIGDMVGDPSYAKRILSAPETELQDRGYDLSDLDIEAIKKLTPEDLELKVQEDVPGLRIVTLREIDVWK